MTRRLSRIALGSALAAGIGIGAFSFLLRPTEAATLMMQNRRSSLRQPGSEASGIRGRATSAALAVASRQPSNAAGAAAITVGMSDGTYTGSREYAYYGYVKVAAVVTNGQITDVQVIEHPNDNGTSQYINSIAMPYLVQEAVQAQGANISLISGATLSSEAFVKSLSNALSQAGA
ncbi:MAG TPA: FMN-binding protein [Spirochaetia bacterium]|nr:FMN-binding protein [Spirochaetia bacterium]